MNEYQVKFSSTFFIVVFISGLLVGGLATYYITSQQVSSLRNEVSNLKAEVYKLKGFQNSTYQNITIYQNTTILSKIYEEVKDSVVLIRGTKSSGIVQGSGFVYNFSGIIVVITNYHVVHGVPSSSISVTFSDGNGYPATVNGTDPYADLAVLTVDAPEWEFKPLEIVRSSTLKVGEPVIAIGNPYGLFGSMTTGVVSALGRTITEEYTGGFAIPNIIQTSTPINPGNSGGPLLNYDGKVVGITTAIVAQSQGLGFAIPSDTILKELASLIENGTYPYHSYIGVRGMDMSFEIAKAMNVNVTYGWLIVQVMSGTPAAQADLRGGTEHVQIGGEWVTIGGDIIIAMNGTRIRNGDDLASYLEENTLPGDTLILTIRRGDQTLNKTLTLGSRPPP